MTIRAVIFDMDGVLVDSEPFGFEALRRVMIRHGLPYSQEENAEFLGRTTLDSCRILKQRHGLPASVETLADWYVEGMLEQIARGPVPMIGLAFLCSGAWLAVTAARRRRPARGRARR